MFSLDPYINQVSKLKAEKVEGKVDEVVGFLIKAYNPGLQVGSGCMIVNSELDDGVPGEVVGFKGNQVLVMALGDIRGIGPQSRIVPASGRPLVAVGDELLGRAIDGMGIPIDGKGVIETDEKVPLYADPINPLQRRRIDSPLDVGVRAINGILTCGKGQRLGILSGSGVGKSVLLGMMARNTTADVNVIALIGERGREVKEFIEKDLGEEGMKRSIIIAATSDQSPLVRLRGAYLATAIAEYFREKEKDVLLMMDSVSRFAMAQREVGLAVGEPPTTKGYPPSVFGLLPKLLERAGNSSSRGSLTGFYTVLVEADDPLDPIGDAVRSIVDGHILLDREIAARGHYPAIDVLRSKSRVMVDVASSTHQLNARKLIKTLAVYKEAEDLINIGAYVKGSNPDIDYALKKIGEINGFLQQGIEESSLLLECEARLEQMFQDYVSAEEFPETMTA
ncbi:MAG: FliI/YscN family ATPase [Deltaproteobacteria bacterium]|nr:FliI/YscN family ATPase [Deltaproteobacteria bacterium]MBT4264729.1 FliI/YscN family ATPase [Deltaproteobacteria bacterium]MBT4640436.1 FliI/YscN family ATPase [Deltaproteobacteria bacterium]MBT6502895.1 FliI/YscN family ATPase [Deltaproteobacteria bacterium]MBT7154397.1 FliI/YscN family ATPase [Deltaproteobacteria bacterium]